MKKEFIVERNGKSFVLYAGLLEAAHEGGLKSIQTTLVQIPSELNAYTAIVHATVETTQGTFTGIGDASPENVSRMILPHSIRMAETRAKARALRDAVNVGITALEELGGDGAAELEHGQAPGPDNAPRPSRPAALHPIDADGPASEAPHYRETNRAYSAAEGAPPSGARPGAAPATPKQLQTIQRMARASGKPIPTDNLTRAQASEIISSLIGEMDQRQVN